MARRKTATAPDRCVVCNAVVDPHKPISHAVRDGARGLPRHTCQTASGTIAVYLDPANTVEETARAVYLANIGDRLGASKDS